ncbi:hypothetical protein GZH53_15860 [Flavihumibacter sp. R14]|nr:hypothetical protein [Flavihumibacter soli]
MEITVNEGSELALLTPKQKERYNYFLPFYGEEAMDVIKNLSTKGENSFPSVQKKLNSLLHAPYHEKEYINALYEAFETGSIYTPDQIIQEVSQVRSSLGLEPYLNVKSSSLADFFRLFLFERITDDSNRKLQAYKPVFRLKPE